MKPITQTLIDPKKCVKDYFECNESPKNLVSEFSAEQLLIEHMLRVIKGIAK